MPSRARSRSRQRQPTKKAVARARGLRVTASAEREAPIAVLGAGSWGTALAIQLARSGRATRLWGRDVAQLRAMSTERRNARYLPGATFPESLTVATELPAALHGSLDVLVAVPSHSFRSV